MKLLIATQTVDREDPVLGFFHHWLEELAGRCESIEVICLREGAHALPDNVRVCSLGKEQGARSRLAYAYRFKMLIWKLRGRYDTVFVHMNPEYMILGGLFWRVFRKHAALWYNHPQRDARFKLAAFLARKVFYTSPYAAPALLGKARRMPVGIDTELFAPRPVSKNRYALYMQGRIMPSKRAHIALEALRILRSSGTAAVLTFVGPELDPAYGEKLRADFADLVEANALAFLGPRRNEETPNLYSAHGVALNLAANGYFDKTAFESMACETPVVVTSAAFEGIVPAEWIVSENDPKALAEAILKLFKLSGEEYRALGSLERAVVVREHGLATLMDRLVVELNRT
ncbi:MAG: glycosyltransferase family 4 protein [bacterium]